jgi:hypothetical protein
MIRSVPTGASFSFRRRMGATLPATAALASTALTAGIGAGVSLASTAITDWMNSIQLSHDADTATTLIVNGLQQQLAALDAAYLATPNPTCATQRAALNAFDAAWQWLQSPAACGNPSYGKAGNECISARAPGGQWDMTKGDRDPIANDPRLIGQCDTGTDILLPSLTTGSYTDTGVTSTGGSSITGQTAAQIAAAAVAAAATPAISTAPATTLPVTTTPATTVPATTTSSNTPLYIGAGILAFLLLVKS